MEDLTSTIVNSLKKCENLEAVYQFVCNFITTKTEASRASIWLYNDYRDSIICQYLKDKRNDANARGETLNEEDFPTYFIGLEKGDTIIADNARNHPYTEIFTELYFEPNDIFSLLDTPIRANGEIVGVICCEHCEEFRSWTDTDIRLSQTMAEEVGRYIENQA